MNLKIYYTSDVHGYMYPTTYGDSLTKNVGLFSCVQNFKKDGNTLIIDGGDMLQGSALAGYCSGTLKSSKKLSEIANDCGYDFYTLGNHDFNYGPAYFKEYIKNHKGTCVCQNVCDEAGNVLFPYTVKTMENGLRVGLVGIVTDYVNVWEKEINLKGLKITNPFTAAEKSLRELRKISDIVICIYHGGFESDLTTGRVLTDTTENVGYKICKELDFDILLTGHQHMSVDGQYVNGTYTVQPLDQAKEYHYIEADVTDAGIKVTSKKLNADASSIDNKLKEKYQPLEDAVQNWLNSPVGHLNKELKPDTKINMALKGNGIADLINKIQLYFTKSQLSVCSLANNVSGFNMEVTTRDIIASYPYPNTLAVVKITGAQLKAAMERSAEYFEIAEDGSVQVAKSFVIPKEEHYNFDFYAGEGLEYEYDPYKPLGSRVVTLKYEGKDIKPEDEFTCSLNNYRLSGTGGYPMYPACPLVKMINIEMSELITQYFVENPHVTM